MKKIIFLLIIICSSQLSIGQESEVPRRDLKKNELSLNIHFTAILYGISITYERILNPNYTVGMEIYARVSSADEEFDFTLVNQKPSITNLAATPKFRWYFSDKIARGIYLEGFGMLSSGEVEFFSTNPDGNSTIRQINKYNEIAVGAALGVKFVLRKGFLIDINFGLGQNILRISNVNHVLRFGLNLGYRFKKIHLQSI